VEIIDLAEFIENMGKEVDLLKIDFEGAECELLDKFFIENRTLVDYEDLSPYLVDALIATEDVRYNRHSGIDVRSLSRVVVKSLLLGQDAGGGSTISQQLAKNLFPRDTTQNKSKLGRAAHLAIVKFKEWNTAVRLERSYTKKEILTMYLNTVPFGGEAVIGIKSASRTFFDNSTDSLKLEEAAVLVGMLKAPTRFNPYLNPENALLRRNIVIDQMVKYDYLDSLIADSVKQIPVRSYYNIAGHMQGNANHFRTFLRVSMNAERPVRSDYPEYGEERFSELACSFRGKSANNIVDEIVKEVSLFSGTQPQFDDITLMIIKRD